MENHFLACAAIKCMAVLPPPPPPPRDVFVVPLEEASVQIYSRAFSRILTIESVFGKSITQSINKIHKPGAPGWLSRLSIRLQLRSPSCSPWVRAPHRALG